MTRIESAYKKHIQEKTVAAQRLLDQASYGNLLGSIIPSPIKDGYRNRTKFKIFGQGDRFELRGMDPIKGEVPSEQALWILPSWGRDIFCSVADIIRSMSRTHRIDGFEIQLAHGRKEAHITLSVRRTETLAYAEISRVLLKEIPGLKGVAIPSQKDDFGDVFLKHCISNIDFLAHYNAFFQSNFHLTPRLMEKIKTELTELTYGNIIDLYCGVGLISLYLDEKAHKIIGVDSNRSAVESACENAQRLRFTDTFFICQSVEKLIQRADFCSQDIVIIDPPRSGCPASVISGVAAREPKNVCLVSCALETHVRDLVRWEKEGYIAISLTAFDMFPFTEFLETVTLLKKNKNQIYQS